LAFLAVLLSAFFVIFPSQWRRLFVVEVPMDKADALIEVGKTIVYWIFYGIPLQQ
jgi:uncharacterized protein YjeT (DUF2065 family)